MERTITSTSKMNPGRKKIAVVVSAFNDFITERLLKGCLTELKQCGVKDKNVVVAKVPGAFEIPLTALKFARKKDVAAVICLGCVIKGETLHYELVAQGAADGIMQVALSTEKPVIFEVIATDTIRKAQQRAQDKGRNKGRDAARAAVEMVNVIEQLR